MTIGPTIVYHFRPFVQGTDWSRTLTFTTAGVADVLTSYTARMVVRDKPHQGGNIILDISTTPNTNGSSIVITGASGLVTINLTDLDTDLLTMDTAYYDLKLTSPSGSGYLERVPITGTLSIIRKITP